MIRMFKNTAKFVVVMLAMTIAFTIFWQDVVAENLYDNTDENMLGFLHPFFLDGWIGQGRFPVVTVEHIVHGRNMSDPDEIKAGWSIPGLWFLWLSLFSVSVGTGIFLARRNWIPRYD